MMWAVTVNYHWSTSSLNVSEAIEKWAMWQCSNDPCLFNIWIVGFGLQKVHYWSAENNSLLMLFFYNFTMLFRKPNWKMLSARDKSHWRPASGYGDLLTHSNRIGLRLRMKIGLPTSGWRTKSSPIIKIVTISVRGNQLKAATMRCETMSFAKTTHTQRRPSVRTNARKIRTSLTCSRSLIEIVSFWKPLCKKFSRTDICVLTLCRATEISRPDNCILCQFDANGYPQTGPDSAGFRRLSVGVERRPWTWREQVFVGLRVVRGTRHSSSGEIGKSSFVFICASGNSSPTFVRLHAHSVWIPRFVTAFR